MFQIIKHILSDPKDRTRIQLVYANIAPDDILLKRDLDKLAAQHPTQLDIFYVIEKEVKICLQFGIIGPLLPFDFIVPFIFVAGP